MTERTLVHHPHAAHAYQAPKGERSRFSRRQQLLLRGATLTVEPEVRPVRAGRAETAPTGHFLLRLVDPADADGGPGQLGRFPTREAAEYAASAVLRAFNHAAWWREETLDTPELK